MARPDTETNLIIGARNSKKKQRANLAVARKVVLQLAVWVLYISTRVEAAEPSKPDTMKIDPAVAPQTPLLRRENQMQKGERNNEEEKAAEDEEKEEEEEEEGEPCDRQSVGRVETGTSLTLRTFITTAQTRIPTKVERTSAAVKTGIGGTRIVFALSSNQGGAQEEENESRKKNIHDEETKFR
jgi:hypothetical protein